MVQVLSKKVATNSNQVYQNTQEVQWKHGLSKEEEQEQKEVKKFWHEEMSYAIAKIVNMGKSKSFHWGLDSYYQSLQELWAMETYEDDLALKIDCAQGVESKAMYKNCLIALCHDMEDQWLIVKHLKATYVTTEEKSAIDMTNNTNTTINTNDDNDSSNSSQK